MAIEALMCAADGCQGVLAKYEEFPANEWGPLKGSAAVIEVAGKSAMECPVCQAVNEISADGFRGKPRVVGVID